MKKVPPTRHGGVPLPHKQHVFSYLSKRWRPFDAALRIRVTVVNRSGHSGSNMAETPIQAHTLGGLLLIQRNRGPENDRIHCEI